MTALTADRPIRQDIGEEYTADVAAATTIYAGAHIMQDTSGNAVPAAETSTLRSLGVAMEQVDNSGGAAGDETVKYRRGNFLFANSSGGDEITLAERGEFCFAVDDQTVAKTSDSGARPVAGKIMGIDAATSQVIVEVGYYTSADGDLVAANNLSDVASAATSRANLGANLVALQFTARASLDDAATTLRVVSPVAGDITDLLSVISGALTGGDPTLTFSINGTPITGGVITIANSGSAAGDVDSATPSAAKTVAVDDVIECAVAANSQSNDEYADISVRIET